MKINLLKEYAALFRTCAMALCLAGALPSLAQEQSAPPLPWIEIHNERFLQAGTGERFLAWGFNYDHDDAGRLLEDYWENEWPTVAEDFLEMKAMGANVVRVHLQLGRFMETADRPDRAALNRLSNLVALAESTGLYLDITGLGCYHKDEVPVWYDALDESKRWDVQARFWGAVAETCRSSPAIFCYDLMNEPVLPGRRQSRDDWLAGDFGGKHFVQFLALDLGERTRSEVAKAWVDRMVAAIRRHDTRRLITVGVIPWALTFPGAQPLFYSEDVGAKLDFVSVHFYPKADQIDKALDALSVYDVGKPLVIEEIFPLECGVKELDDFIEGSRRRAEGWIGFYWGTTREEYAGRDADMKGALIKSWLDYFVEKGPRILGE
jgi:hypothetical protein